MIFLLLAIACSAMISIFLRMSTNARCDGTGVLSGNYIVCSALALCFVRKPVGNVHFTIGMGLFTGLMYLLSFLMLQINVKKNGVVLSSIFGKLGLIVSLALSIVFFHELPGPAQIAGTVLAVASIVLINLEKDTSAMNFRLGLILLLFISGTSDATSKIFSELGQADQSGLFLFLVFLTALILCLALMRSRKEHLGKAELLYGALIGVPNYFSAKFTLLALDSMPAVIVYPTFSVGTIIVISLAGVLLFHEKLGKRQWVAMGGILVALALLNL